MEKYKVGIARVLTYFDFLNEITAADLPGRTEFDYFSEIACLVDLGYFQYKKSETDIREGTRLIVVIDKEFVIKVSENVGFMIFDYLTIPI